MLRDRASRLVVGAGATRLGRRLGDRMGTIILYGHRVSDDEEAYFQGLSPAFLRDQVRYLTRHYEVIPLRTLVACMVEQRPPPPRTVVLTFDDGFRDNVEHAQPILDDFGVPATVFVVTESLTDGKLPWAQRLGIVFQRTEQSAVQHPLLGPEQRPLDTEARRRGAYSEMMDRLAPLPRRSRDEVIEELGERLGIEPPRDRMMTWEHARAWLAAGHEIGAHTFSHALLARVSPDEARWEMERSRGDLEEHLGLRQPSFCFPAGSTTPALRAMVRELGFASCFVPNSPRRLNRPGDMDAFSLTRVGLPNAPAAHLEAELDGPFHTLRRLARRYPPPGAYI